jgi:hypothetical protein
MLEGAGSHEAVYSATEVAFNLPPDLDGRFYAALGLSQFGGERGADRAVAVLGDLIGRGFVPYDMFMQHPWLQSLRHRPDFIEILQDGKHRHQEAQTAFTQAGGAALLGAGTKGSDV